jgi:hypothetical protein
LPEDGGKRTPLQRKTAAAASAEDIKSRLSRLELGGTINDELRTTVMDLTDDELKKIVRLKASLEHSYPFLTLHIL